jgi:hypothetical protein
MKASIAGASRRVTAMRAVAYGVAASAKAASENLTVSKDARLPQMRAYLTVAIIRASQTDCGCPRLNVPCDGGVDTVSHDSCCHLFNAAELYQWN